MKFHVDGIPIQQGSMKVFNGHVVHAKGTQLLLWRALIAMMARDAGVGKAPSDKAIQLDLVFSMKKPKSVKRDMPTVAPDLDKLVRSVLDALTGVAYEDDSQVVVVNASKVYGDPGLDVQITVLS